MREYFRLVRIDCDGCGLAVLECMEGGVEGALRECGWVQIPDKVHHLCPVCRPDSPFEAVKRARSATPATATTPTTTRAAAGGCQSSATNVEVR